MADTVQASGTVYMASFGALLGALSMGLALGYTAPAFIDMERDTNSTILDPDSREEQKSLIGSILAIGALVGGFLGEPCNKMLGRRISLIIYGIPFALGWLLMATASNLYMFVAGRILTGLCCGLASGTAPTYVVEIAPTKIRGMLGTCFQVMVVIGILLVAVFGLFMSWRSLAGWSIVAAAGMSLVMIFMPETPQWLLSKGRSEEAEASLSRLRSGPVTSELNIMKQAANNAQQSGSQYSCKTITNPEFYRPMILALGLFFFQQFSGVNAVLFYQGDIFSKASPTINALQATIFVCLAQVIATVIGSFLVDRLGRRVLLLASGAGHSLSLLMFGFYSYKSAKDAAFQTDYAWMAMTSLIVFISSFSLGFGPIPWMMIPELSSNRVRSIVASISTAFNWTCVYVVTATVKSMISRIGDAATYWIYAAICVLSCLFVYFCVPETKGKSSEQIQMEILGTEMVENANNNNQQRRDEPMKNLA